MTEQINKNSTREEVIAAVKKTGADIALANVKFRNDKEIAKIAVINFAYSYTYISKNLQNNKEIALLAIKGDGSLLFKMHNLLKNDREIVVLSLTNCPEAIAAMPDSYKFDEEIWQLMLNPDKKITFNKANHAIDLIEKSMYKKELLSVIQANKLFHPDFYSELVVLEKKISLLNKLSDINIEDKNPKIKVKL